MAKKKFSKGKVYRSGNYGVIDFADHAYTFNIAGSGEWNKGTIVASPSFLPFANRIQSENIPLQVGMYKIVPLGYSNQLPHELREVLEDSNLSEGIFNRQGNLLTGKGPRLYENQLVNGEHKRVWVEDPEVENWLESFDYELQLENMIVDYYHMEGVYAKFYRNLGVRIGKKPFISRVEHVKYHRCRLEWPEDLEHSLNIITGDWYNPNVFGLKCYPVFDKTRPFDYPLSMTFVNKYSFGHDYYGLPSYWGALGWISRGAAIPKILEALTKNSLNIKWHITSPAAYWEDKREMLQNRCNAEGKTYTEEMLEDLKDKIFNQLATVLSGEKNVGKFFESMSFYDQGGNLCEWKIEPIDQKVKDFIDAQIVIAKHADSAITSGTRLHPSLSNIIVDGKLASGSEQLYAYKLHLATEVHYPELKVCQPINMAIAANWPEKKVKLGFYQEIVKTEATTSPQNRIKNVV